MRAALPRIPAGRRAEAKVAARPPFEQRSEDHRRLVGRFERLLRVTTDEVRAALTPPDKAEWERLDQAIAAVNARRPVPPQIHAVFDTAKPTPVHVLRRGEFDQPAEEVQPSLPVVLRAAHRPVGRDSVEPHLPTQEARAQRASRLGVVPPEMLAALEMGFDGVSPYRGFGALPPCGAARRRVRLRRVGDGCLA